MTEQPEPRDPQFMALVEDAVREGIERVVRVAAEKRFIGTHFNWPTVKYQDNGLPNFAQLPFGGPTDYSAAFGKGERSAIDYTTLPTFIALLEYAWQHTRIQPYFSPSPHDGDEDRDLLFDTMLRRLIGTIIDHYMHTYPDHVFSAERLTPIYHLVETAIFAEVLPYAIVVPIVCLPCDFDQVQLSPQLHIIRMPHDMQLARTLENPYSRSVHPIVMETASHDLVLSAWEMPNNDYWFLFDALSRVSTYHVRDIDTAFAALRAVTGYDTGYAQVLAIPIGWAHFFNAQLPQMYSAFVRAYPTLVRTRPLARTASELDGRTSGSNSRTLYEDGETRQPPSRNRGTTVELVLSEG